MRQNLSDARAVWAFVVLGWRRAAAERAALAGRLLLYMLILVIFWHLWRATPLAELAGQGLGVPDLLWYVAVTEWIVFAAGLPYRDVEETIRTGRIETSLVRPVPYAVATLAEWAGASGLHLIALGAAGTAMATWLTGTVPLDAAAVAPLLLAGVLGCSIILLFQLQLGYAVAWVGSAAPLFWIWQKLLFVLGGLLLPLTLYPQPFRATAALSPFAAILFAPGSILLAPSTSAIATALVQQIVWLALLAVATTLVDRAATARFADRGV
ncbi:ABC-2 family transporter protein [Rhodospirillaceae bacterium SYSU D60014]|uniref:ABC-2 family transporter protein n=1 Tax=Virgifigura deserti TaxID=2268457 RepID=UPI000E669C02